MTTETRNDPRKKFVPRYLPWLLALAMLGIYGVTLNRWVSLANLRFVAALSGWTWQPEYFNPLAWLVTQPLRWLAAGQIPLAANLFSAVCAALTLGLLARSVTLLPQDRTEMQRQREISDFSFLTGRGAWLPPVLAVLVCGLQFTFWENATNYTGETLDLLIFAFTVWSLLEYRLDEREGRLLAAMFLFGAGLTEDLGLTGFLPLLLGALIWIRGLSFFNAAFLGRLMLAGLAGVSLFLLLPTVALISGQISFAMWWPVLKYNLAQHWHIVKYFFISGDFHGHLGLISLTTLLPALLPAFRWPASFGDRSQLGNTLTGIMFHLVHAVLLFICIWGTFDPPFSARHLGSGLPFLTFLSFSYLAALSIGYYSGYFLVVSRTLPPRKNSRRQPSALLQFRNPATLVALAVLTILTAAGLVYKNHPAIQSINSGILKQYSRLMEDCLPHSGGLLLSDSDAASDSPVRLFLLQSALALDGRQKEYVPVDTYALNYPDYHRYLHRKYPDKWPLVVDSKSNNELDAHGLLGLMELLSKTNAIYYLQPSFGYYFEVFYPEPHGLIYQLKNLPEDTLMSPQPDGRIKAENDAFWSRAESAAFAPILKEVSPDDPSAHSGNLFDQMMSRLHVAPEPNPNAFQAGSYYSCSLDYWGVQEQRANDLKSAAAHFESAQKLNPDNQVAAINLEFNQNLQAGKPASVDLARTTTEQFSKYHSWLDITKINGPFDDPSFCCQDGTVYLQATYLRQAIASFTRVQQLVPDYLPALLSLGELFDFVHQPERALAVLKEPLTHPAKFSLNDNNSTELNITAAAAFIQKTNLTRGVSLMEKEITHHPDDLNLLTTAVQVYHTQGLYTNALRVIQLRLDHDPNDPVWLYGQAQIYMQMPDYDRAIASLTKVLTLQTNNYDALFNRAVARLNTGKLEAARADYQQVQKVYPKDFRVTYGLGEIAWQRHETNAAILNYTSCLENAPTNMAEFKLVSQRLADLKGKPH